MAPANASPAFVSKFMKFEKKSSELELVRVGRNRISVGKTRTRTLEKTGLFLLQPKQFSVYGVTLPSPETSIPELELSRLDLFVKGTLEALDTERDKGPRRVLYRFASASFRHSSVIRGFSSRVDLYSAHVAEF